ncbi:MAG: FtsX-like permease family protein [bacterium]|nr:FtsX-like permease family protein [bacterium]
MSLPLAEEGILQLRARFREQVLTVLGIVWGAAAVVLLLSFGAGLYNFLDLGFKRTGDRFLEANPEYTSREMGGARPGRKIVFEEDDLSLLRASLPSARWIAAVYEPGAVTVRTADRTRNTVVSANTPDLKWIRVHELARGRFIDDEDERMGRPVAVLGANLPEIFLPDVDPIGQTIQVEGTPLRVIGVLKRVGAQLMVNQALHDDMVFIPLSQGQRIFGLGNAVGSFLLEPHRVDETALLREEFEAAIYPQHHLDPDDKQAIAYTEVREYSEPLKRIGSGLELLLGFVGTVMLAMAGVGVANLMVAIVNQRRMEFAMRRACGARRSDISLQLLVETLCVVGAGGLLGILLATGIVWLFSFVPLPELIPTPRILPSVIATTCFVLLLVGAVSGILPARMASRIDPAAALRVT